MKKIKHILNLILVIILTLNLVACGSQEKEETTTAEQKNEAKVEEIENKDNEVKPITDLMLTKLASAELTTLNILNTETANDRDLLINLWEGLCDNDNKSNVTPAIATDWGTEDSGLTWTFKLRNNVKWVDVDGREKAPVTANDFKTGMEWILNFHKNSSYNTARLLDMVAGAKEYYEYTKELSVEQAMQLTAKNPKFQELVGIDTPDDYTVVYTCTSEIPYFASIATSTSLYPLAQGMVDELGAENINSITNKTMWYNSCYTMPTFVSGNEKVLVKNPSYWDTEASLFETVTIKMVESNDVAYMLFENGENDYATLDESRVIAIKDDPNHKFHDLLIEALPGKRANQMHLNFDKMLPDGSEDANWNTAVANETFRKALYYGIDFIDYYKRFNPIDPMKCENNFYTRDGLCYTTDGTPYVELVRKELNMDESDGVKIAHLDSDKAAEYKKQAMEELIAQNVTFPIVMDYYVSSGQTDMDNALVLKQCIEQSLGTDFVNLEIINYVSNFNSEVRDLGLMAFAINSYGGSYADPSTYLCQEIYGDSNAWYTNKYSRIVNLDENHPSAVALAEYTKLYDDANAITDDYDARMSAFAKAEAYFYERAITVPVYVTNSWCLSNINLNSKMYTMLSGSDEKMKNWETNKNGYTREYMEKINVTN